MFDLYDKLTGKRVTIYRIIDDNDGYPKFLIRDKNKWIYKSAKHYITREERLHTPFTDFERICGID